MEMRPSLALFMVAVMASASAALACPDHGGRPLYATLSGAEEVGTGAGDPDGLGSADLHLNQGQGEICYDVEWSNLDPVTAGHIHKALAGVNGPVVVPLDVTTPDCDGNSCTVSGCAQVDPALIKEIRQNPENYYVNIHTTEHPGGAIRGQLSK